MGRLIDANSILDDFLKRYTEMERDGKIIFAACEVKQDFADMISNAATVDAVPVVRCRDCKWYMPGELFTDIMFCHRLKKDNGKPAKYNYCADDFCSYGERKDGDGNA